MKRFLLILTLGLMVSLSVASCSGDREARTDISGTKYLLREWSGAVDAWNNRVYRAVCQLEADVYDITDSGGDIRDPQGPPSAPGENRLCSAYGFLEPPDPPPLVDSLLPR